MEVDSTHSRWKIARRDQGCMKRNGRAAGIRIENRYGEIIDPIFAHNFGDHTDAGEDVAACVRPRGEGLTVQVTCHGDAIIGLRRVVHKDLSRQRGGGRHVNRHRVGAGAEDRAVVHLEIEARIVVAAAAGRGREDQLAVIDVGPGDDVARRDRRAVERQRAQRRQGLDPHAHQPVGEVRVVEAEIRRAELVPPVLGHRHRLVSGGRGGVGGLRAVDADHDLLGSTDGIRRCRPETRTVDSPSVGLDGVFGKVIRSLDHYNSRGRWLQHENVLCRCGQAGSARRLVGKGLEGIGGQPQAPRRNGERCHLLLALLYPLKACSLFRFIEL